MYVYKYFQFVGWFLLVKTRIVPTLNKVNKYLKEADTEHLQTCKLNSTIPVPLLPRR